MRIGIGAPIQPRAYTLFGKRKQPPARWMCKAIASDNLPHMSGVALTGAQL
jgi:hypothetical protein